MNWILPGTVIPARREEADKTCDLFQSMFLPGGMVLGQVSNISGLEPYMIQNWVKRGFLAPPKGKRYTLRQLCRILNINMLRGALPMEKIAEDGLHDEDWFPDPDPVPAAVEIPVYPVFKE